MRAMAYLIWFSDFDTVNSKVVRSVLKLRQEAWEFVDRPESANFWVVDGTEDYDEQSLISAFNHSSKDPLKVMFLAESDGYTPHSQWHHVELPLNASKLFDFFERHLKDFGQADVQTEESVSIQNTQYAMEPNWRTSAFKLTRWPNIAKYGSDAHLPLTCSNLLRGYNDFNTALSWGLPKRILEQILVDAENDGIILFDTSQVASQAHVSSPELGLFQRFMRRFV